MAEFAQIMLCGSVFGLIVEPKGAVFFIPCGFICGALLYSWHRWPFARKSKPEATVPAHLLTGTRGSGSVSRNELDGVQGVVKNIAETFSAARFNEFFHDQTFAAEWSLGDALAMWFTFGHIALAVSASRVYDNDARKVAQLLELCEPEMRKQWNLSGSMLENFTTAVQRTEPEFLGALAACETGDDLKCLSVRYVDRLLGIPVSLAVQNKESPLSDYFSRGLEPKAGLTFSHSVWQLFMSLVRTSDEAVKRVSLRYD